MKMTQISPVTLVFILFCFFVCPIVLLAENSKHPGLPKYQLKQVEYACNPSDWDSQHEMVTAFINLALNENPGWELVQFHLWIFPRGSNDIYVPSWGEYEKITIWLKKKPCCD